MRDRLTALLGVVLSAVLVYGLFVPKPGAMDIATRPTSEEAGASGQLAARRWLDSEGITTYSLRERFNVLNDENHPAYGPGNLMFMVMPELRHVRAEEIDELRDWVAGGNTLVLLAALNDTPEWSYVGDARFMHDDIMAITGVRFRDGPPPEAAKDVAPASRFARLDEPLWHEIRVDDRHWLGRGVGALSARSDMPTGHWKVAASEDASLFEIGRAEDDGRGVMWLLAEGEGQILLSSYGSLFQNDVIGRLDNRRLLANLVAFHVGRGGIVIFDDMHQGLSAVYDPEAFYGDPRLHHSLLFVLALWLAYVLLANNRVGRLPMPGGLPRQADFVRSIGHFLARKVRPADAARRLFANFPAESGARGCAGAPDWQRLAGSPLLDGALIARLRNQYEALRSGRPVDLGMLHNDLARVRRALR